jgi:hypothetical protein
MFYIIFLFLLILSPARLWAGQGIQTELSGQITDESAAAIPSAVVELTDNETNRSFRNVTTTEGTYVFASLKPGLYTIVAEAPGFQSVRRQGISVVTGEKIRVDFMLRVGTIDEAVNVVSDAPLLRTESATLGQAIENEKITSLPLNGRNFISIVALVPGVTVPRGSSFPRINGGRPRVNEFLFDGLSVLQPEPGQAAFLPIVDAIQEFKVETNSPAAEFGRFNGGVINLTTKSGTNEFHADAFAFLRHESLNARNLFAPATPSEPDKPLFRRNQMGFVVGGPLIHEHFFSRTIRDCVSALRESEHPRSRLCFNDKASLRRMWRALFRSFMIPQPRD